MKYLFALFLLCFAFPALAQTTVTANIHNACAWEPGASYSYHAGPPNGHFTRVNNGPGWTPTGSTAAAGCVGAGGGTYTAGATLNNYQLIAPTTGSCTTGASPGPTGTGSSITDGGCTWKYVGPVDYVTFTGFGFDPGVVWTSGMSIKYMEMVYTLDTNYPVFMQVTPGCTSTVKPTTSNLNTTLSDGCYWFDQSGGTSYVFVNSSAPVYLYYTSKVNNMPMTVWQSDTFQASFTAGSVFSGTGTMAVGGNTLTITAVSSGSLAAGQYIVGPGIAAGTMTYTQSSGPSPCTTASVGTPCVFTTFLNQTGTSTPSTYTTPGGTLNVTTPPATYPLTIGYVVDYTGNVCPQTQWRAAGSFGNGGLIIVSGSGTTWTVATNCTATPVSAGTTTMYVAGEGNSCCGQTGTSGTSFQLNVGLLWNDQEYVSGVYGESSPIGTYNHNYHYNDDIYYTYLNIDPAVVTAGYPWGYPTVIKPAPGEGFQDTFAANPSLALTGYNANNGVGLRGVGVPGYSQADNGQVLQGLQMTSDTQAAQFGQYRAGNAQNLIGNILEGGTGALDVAFTGASQYFENDLIIAHGPVGIQLDYGGFSVNNTIVCPSGTCVGAGIDNTIDFVNPNGSVVNGTLEFGFAHFISSSFYTNQDDWRVCTSLCLTHSGTNNITDVASTDGVGWDTACTPWSACTGYSFSNPTSSGVISYAVPFKTGYTYTSGLGAGTNLCGHYASPGASPIYADTCSVTNSVSPSSVFVAWPGNYKILNTSVAYGGGASYPTYDHYGFQGNINWDYNTLKFCNGTWPGCVTYSQPNTPDVFANARPQAGSRFDVGAQEIVGGTGTPVAGGHLFR